MLHLAIDFLYRHREHRLESSDKFLSSLGHELLTLLDNMRRLNIIVMECGHFDLDSLDSVAAHKAHLI